MDCNTLFFTRILLNKISGLEVFSTPPNSSCRAHCHTSTSEAICGSAGYGTDKTEAGRVPLSVKFSGSLVNVVELNFVLKEPETMQFGMVADHDDDAGAQEEIANICFWPIAVSREGLQSARGRHSR
jgi:hypothetical protein